MARRRRLPAPPLPAELEDFDCLYWALPGEEPSERAWDEGFGSKSSHDYYLASRRHSEALVAWFRAHPDVDFLEWLQTKRARRRAAARASG